MNNEPELYGMIIILGISFGLILAHYGVTFEGAFKFIKQIALRK